MLQPHLVQVYSGNSTEIIPEGTSIYLSTENKKNLIVKYKNKRWKTSKKYLGSFIVQNDYYNYKSYNTSPNYNNSSSGGSVQVKGYYRKDGTYVKPHTRRAPSRRK